MILNGSVDMVEDRRRILSFLTKESETWDGFDCFHKTQLETESKADTSCSTSPLLPSESCFI